MSMLPTNDELEARAAKLYEDIRDVSKRDAVLLISYALIEAIGKGGEIVFAELRKDSDERLRLLDAKTTGVQ